MGEKKLSLIIPCYNEQESLGILYSEMIKVLETVDYQCELLFVDDGSKDKTLDIIKEFSEKDSRVK